MGHAQLSATMMYTYVTDNRMGAALSQMEDILMSGALSEWEMIESDRKIDRNQRTENCCWKRKKSKTHRKPKDFGLMPVTGLD